jgi:hypothetical protein
MPKKNSRRKKMPTRVLALPDLAQTKAAVLNSLTSASGQRTYDHAIREVVAWYCSEPALRSTAPSCSGTGYTSNSAGMHQPRSTFGSRQFGAWRTRWSPC